MTLTPWNYWKTSSCRSTFNHIYIGRCLAAREEQVTWSLSVKQVPQWEMCFSLI